MKRICTLLSGILCLLLSSCIDHEAENARIREQLIAEGVEIKISEFIQHEWGKCVDQARTMAVARADSIIRANAKEESVEPVQKPPKPNRPDKPPIRVLPDSLRLAVPTGRDSTRNK